MQTCKVAFHRLADAILGLEEGSEGRQRLVIGWERNGTPRTYRVMRPQVWHVRLARSILTSVL